MTTTEKNIYHYTNANNLISILKGQTLNAHTTGQIIAGGLLGMVIGVSVFCFLK